MEDGGVKASDVVANEYATYEDFLDSQISPVDLYYLEVRLARGYSANTLTHNNNNTRRTRSLRGSSWSWDTVAQAR